MAFKITNKNIVGTLWLSIDPNVGPYGKKLPDCCMVGRDSDVGIYRLISLIDGFIYSRLTYTQMKDIVKTLTYIGNIKDLDIESFIAEKHA